MQGARRLRALRLQLEALHEELRWLLVRPTYDSVR